MHAAANGIEDAQESGQGGLMGFVDCHVHLFPDAAAADPQGWAAARGEHRWARMVAPRAGGRQVQGWAGVERMLRDMDAAGIDRAVLQGWYWETPATCEEHNQIMAEAIAAHPDRLSAVATFHPAGCERSLDTLRSARDAGFVGIGELCPEAQGYAHDDPIFERALDLASEWGWPVTLHVTEPAGRDYPGRVETPLMKIVELVSAHPHVKFVLAHWGGLLPFFEMNASVARSLANASYDTAASPLIYGAGITKAVAAAIGTGRILFGSDYPILPRGVLASTFEPFLDVVREGGLAAGEIEAILGGNARALYRLP
ncbi:MAG TPA: amidohydrolase family protein [Opitutaceae bacterium]|nr:amidohydrolase family protein [Opitutaceae bacterium]